MKTHVLAVVLALVAILFTGCGTLSERKEFPEGVLIQYERTKALGHDNSGAIFIPKIIAFPSIPIQAPATASTVSATSMAQIQRTTETKVRTWSNCSDKEPNPRHKNFWPGPKDVKVENFSINVQTPLVAASAPAPTTTVATATYGQPIMYGGGNPSLFNLTGPAMALGAGYWAGQAARRPSDVNSNVTSTGGTGGSSSSSSSAASSSASAAAAAAGKK